MTLAESANLMRDATFLDRVKAAALIYALHLHAQPNGPQSRRQWIQNTFNSPEGTASQLIGGVVMNVNVQTAGADVSDADLQAAVQAVADVAM